MLLKLSEKQYPTIKEDVFEKMEETILKAKENLDSVGGKVECVALHVPAGVGEPFFDSLESHLSSLMFSIPAVKSVSFGDGESIDEMFGSEANDCYYYDEEGYLRAACFMKNGSSYVRKIFHRLNHAKESIALVVKNNEKVYNTLLDLL